jgi:hypothetical protein
MVPNALFVHLRTEVEEWIDRYRVPYDGPLDLKATAARIGFELEVGPWYWRDGEPMMSQGCYIWTPEGRRILINTWRPHLEWTVTFGHEVAHDYLQHVLRMPKGMIPAEYPAKEPYEQFCEWFGYAMALPTRWLRQRGTTDIETISREMQVDAETVIYQLWQADMGPDIRTYDYIVYCRFCHDPEVGNFAACPCHALQSVALRPLVEKLNRRELRRERVEVRVPPGVPIIFGEEVDDGIPF